MSLNLENQDATQLNQIYNDPDIQFALDLSNLFNRKALNEIEFKKFLGNLPASAALERVKLEKLIDDGSAHIDADLSTRAGQLVWAAGLGFIYQNSPPNTVRTHPIWRLLTRNTQLSESLGTVARYIDLSITNRNATMDWGTPGSWFWFSPDNNHINIDLFNTLLTGFAPNPAPSVKGLAHTTGIMMHEVGHSQLTTRFTDGMLALKKRETELHDASKKRKLTAAEFKELARNRTEFQLRLDVLNAAEDNCVNQFAVDRSRDFPHDFRTSLNISNVVLQGTGTYLKDAQDKDEDPVAIVDPEQHKIAEAKEKLHDLGKILAMAFYTTTGLFDKNDIETWQELGIDPEKINAAHNGTIATAASQFLGAQSDFDRLLDLAVGRNGISSLQPAERDRWLLQNIFAKGVNAYADQRCQIIDDIWNKYAAPYAEVLLNAAEQHAENQMEQKKQEQDSEQSPQNGQSTSQGLSTPQENQDDPSPSQGGGQQSSPSQPDGQPGQQSGSPQPGQGNSADSASSGGASGNASSQEGEPQNSAGENTDAPSSVDVEGVGKMDTEGKSLPATPEEARKAERSGEDENAKPADAKTVRDLAREAKQLERNANPGSGDNAAQPGVPADGLTMDVGDKGGRQKGIDLANLSKGSWSDFRKRINELEPVVARIAEDFTYIRDKQKHPVRTVARKKEELPRGGDIVGRLDMRSQMILATKRATGQQPELPDRQKWRVDEIQAEATSVELWILGDGSASMSASLTGGGRRIDSAVQSMAILYEAGRRANFDTFVGMWGDNKIRLLAKPGDSEQVIGQNFETVRNGINSGTQLSPSFIQAIERSAKQESNAEGRPKKFAGMTHFLIISDGELNNDDIAPTAKVLKQLFRYGPAVSVDIAILGGSGSEMQQVVNIVKKTNPAAAIDIIRADNAKEIPKQLAAKIKKRFEKSAEDILAVPDPVKRDAFTNAHRAIIRL